MSDWNNAQTTIPLSKGRVAIIDPEDYDSLSQWKWYYSHGYAIRHPSMVGGIRKGKIMMHRVIAKTPNGVYTDHINGNGLDNRKSNLRFVSHAQNMWNSKLERNTSTGIKNVSVFNGGYQVRVQKDGKRYFAGFFKDISEAVSRANTFRKEYYGEYTRN